MAGKESFSVRELRTLSLDEVNLMIRDLNKKLDRMTAFLPSKMDAINALLDNTGGSADSILQRLADPQAGSEDVTALKRDLAQSILPAIRNNFSDLAAKLNVLLERLRTATLLRES